MNAAYLYSALRQLHHFGDLFPLKDIRILRLTEVAFEDLELIAVERRPFSTALTVVVHPKLSKCG